MTNNSDLKIGGRVTVRQGDDILVDNVENHIVNQGLKGIISMLCGSYDSCTSLNQYSYSNRYYATINCGTDTTHRTTYSTTDLSAKIATAPNAFSSLSPNAIITSKWVMQYIAIWNPGVITSQVGEIGLYNGNYTNITPGWTSANTSYAASLFSRISASDSDFVAFTPVSTQSLVITWEIGVAA